VRLTVTDLFQRSHTSTESNSLAIETIGWRPPKVWRWPATILFYLVVALVWRCLPWGLRRVAYESDEMKKRHRSWTRDLTIRSGDISVTLRLHRNWWLRKFYTLETKGTVQWTSGKGEKPDRQHLQARDKLTLGDKVYTIRSLNNSVGTGLRTPGVILILTAVVAWRTWPLFF
jgi:hypothetical protein